MVLTVKLYTAAHLMDLRSGMDSTSTYLPMHQQLQIHTQTLVTPTVPPVGPAFTAPSPEHFWQGPIPFNRMK